MDNGKIKFEVIALVFAILVLATAVSGITYSYFSVAVNRTGTAGPETITSGNLDINFSTGTAINKTDMFLIPSGTPIKDHADAAKLTFDISNTASATLPAKYIIYLTELAFDVGGKWKSADLKWELYKGSTKVANGDFASIGTNTELQLYNNAGAAVPLGTTDYYTLYLGLVETTSNQVNLAGGSISCKVKVVATP